MGNIDQGSSPTNLDEVSLKDLIIKIVDWFTYLFSKWKTIVIAGIIGALIGLGYSLLKKPLFKAELSFVLEDERSSGAPTGALGLASQFGFGVNSNSGAFSGDNLLELIKSRFIVEKALLSTDTIGGKVKTIAEYYIDFNNLRNGWKDNPELEALHFPSNSDRAMFTTVQDSVLGSFYKELIQNNIIVGKLDKKLSIMTLSVQSVNEVFSKKFTEILAKVVSDFYIQTKTQKLSKNVAKLQHQTDSLRTILNSAIGKVAYSADINPNPNPLLQSLRVPSQRKQIEVQINTAILNQLVINLEMSKMSLLQQTPLIQIIDKPILPLEKVRPGKIRTPIMIGFIFGLIICVILIIEKSYKEIMS